VAVLDAGPPALTLGPAAIVMAFFWLHALLVLGERSGGVLRGADRGPGLFWRRLRTGVLFAVLSPLLLDPFATVANVHGRRLDAPQLRIPPATR